MCVGSSRIMIIGLCLVIVVGVGVIVCCIFGGLNIICLVKV